MEKKEVTVVRWYVSLRDGSRSTTLSIEDSLGAAIQVASDLIVKMRLHKDDTPSIEIRSFGNCFGPVFVFIRQTPDGCELRWAEGMEEAVAEFLRRKQGQS